MRHITLFASICLYFLQIQAQNLPQGIAYQAVAVKEGPYSIAGQNPQAIYWSNKEINVRFTIYDKFPNGTNSYSETHTTKTDDYGVFNLIIGQGNVISGEFEKIPWGLGTAHLQVEIDFDNNEIYKLTSLERFWSVPYAFVSNSQKGANSTDKDTVVGNELQKLTRNGDTIFLSDGGGQVSLLDDDPKNELQDIFIKNDSLFLSNSKGGIPLSNLLKSSIPTTKGNPILTKNIDIDLICLEEQNKNLGLLYPSIEYHCEIGDSIYYFGRYTLPSLSEYGSFIVAKSKLDCNSKLTYKSNSLDFSDMTWGNVGRKVYFSINADLITFDLQIYSKSKIAINFPNNGTNQTGYQGSNNMGLPRAWSTFKDTGYIIFRKIRTIGGSTYWQRHMLYKFNLNNGQILSIDSNNNYEMFEYSIQSPVQYMDSCIFFWHNDSLKQLDFRTAKQKVIWTSYRYSLPPMNQRFFHIYTNDILILEIRTIRTGTPENLCLITDLKTDKNIADHNFYIYQRNYSYYWQSKKRSIGKNGKYLIYDNSVQNPWNFSSIYLSPPDFYYPK